MLLSPLVIDDNLPTSTIDEACFERLVENFRCGRQYRCMPVHRAANGRYQLLAGSVRRRAAFVAGVELLCEVIAIDRWSFAPGSGHRDWLFALYTDQVD